ncbi:MAG: hypothetical protein AB1486_17120 [Planctomycetota bacterium]
MNTDRGLEATRAIREKISREHGNDPRRLVEYYLRYQERFAGRLRRASGEHQGSGEPAERAETPDGAPPHR